MKNKTRQISKAIERFLDRFGLNMRVKLISIFLIVKIVPLVLIAMIAWRQFSSLSAELRSIAITDSRHALTAGAVEDIERITADTARRVADFLYARDDDIRYLASLAGAYGGDMDAVEMAYAQFVSGKMGRLVKPGRWELAPDGKSWAPSESRDMSDTAGKSTNAQNDDVVNGSGFHSAAAESLEYELAPLYDEVTFIGLDGVEKIKVGTAHMETSRKSRYKEWFETGDVKDVSDRRNTFIRAESYWPALEALQAPQPGGGPGGDIYVSDVIGAYVGSNYIGMYTEENVAAAARARGYAIGYAPEAQAFAGEENPNGLRFEGIVRWAAPVFAGGAKIGYVTLALNHDHIMEFVDHQTPMSERYTELPSAHEGNYAFIWDYQCRSIAHPRHNSITGYDPRTGEPQVPWIPQSLYGELLERSGVDAERAGQMTAEERFGAIKRGWSGLTNSPEGGEPVRELIKGQPLFEDQRRTASDAPDPDHTPAADLTRLGYVGLDGRYLNNAPQCTGWMDLTERG
ncbi:MAG: hypothetical protein LBJ10_04080, partial [Clostridiales bacterium]|nr:hypothetical protein [Clostridiales bacterium]